MVAQVLADETALGENLGLHIRARTRRRDHSDHRRLAERVNLGQLRGRKGGLLAVVDLELIRHLELRCFGSGQSHMSIYSPKREKEKRISSIEKTYS